MELEQIIVQSVADLEEERTIRLVKKAVHQGMAPREAIACMRRGLDEVGQLYENGEYYLGDLIMAGIIFREVLALDEVKIDLPKDPVESKGTILIGTVKKDIHDLGKNIFIGMAQAEGFHVIDLGVDVDPEVFVRKIREHRPHILGLSGLMTFARASVIELLERLHAEGLRDGLKIMVGGNLMQKSEETPTAWADAYMGNAETGVEICSRWAEEWQ